MIHIYSTPTCAPCRTLKRYLDIKQLPYKEFPADTEEYYKLATIYGSMKPLVMVGDQGFVGMNITRLNELLDGQKQAKGV